MNQYFPSDQSMMFQSHAWVMDPFKVQDRTMDFNLTEYEDILCLDSDFTLLLTLKKLCGVLCFPENMT